MKLICNRRSLAQESFPVAVKRQICKEAVRIVRAICYKRLPQARALKLAA